MPPALVIAWWGPDLAILGPDGRLARGYCRPEEDPAAAIGELLDAEFPGPAAARLLYQPDTLAAHEVACPAPSRRQLRRLLAGDFPALRSRAAVWAAAPPRPARDGYATVLYLEPASPLPRLQTALAERGIGLEGAWPMPALWEIERPAAEFDRGYLGVAAGPRRAVVFCLSPAGDRSVRLTAGPVAPEDAAAEIRRAFARFDEADRPRAVLAATPGPEGDAWREGLAPCALEEITLADWMSRARQLETGGLGDLLPRDSLLRRGPRQCRFAAAAGLLLLALAAFWTERHCQTVAAAARAGAARRAESARAQETLSTRASLRERIDHLQGAWRAAQAPASRDSAFIVALARAAAEGVVLQSVRIAGDEFEVRGRPDPDPTRAADRLRRFRRALFIPGQPWRADSADEAPADDGAFVLRGSWTPQSPP
jgi:hypothetical protein